ncbi:Hypothetical protein CINCED_3A013073 [Cinara cedri]|uniref:Uncharacterized protein n=1 Tax=Cinara cedri TaxID=506608 RepID=A0A5E4MJA4_9HEMI|nr:Hypothetical protein CINCED_3A013073 [Cinara cedri]
MIIRMIAEVLNANKETVRKILHNELNMKKVCAKLVPKYLTPDQKLVRQQICSDILERLEEEPELIENIITCDFYLFPKIKSALKGTRFELMEEVKRKSAELLNDLTKTNFQHCFEQWKKRMKWCVERGGEYIEGEHLLWNNF